MNNHKPINPNTHRRSQLSRRLLWQYFLTVIGYVAALLLLAFLGELYCNRFIWYSNDPLYQILVYIKKHIVVFIGIPAFLGWAAITYYFMSRPLRYLDEVVNAARHLVYFDEEPVQLSTALLVTQNEFNTIRENARQNALAAREAEQRKQDLIVYLAHDLKTPLTSIIGYLTLLRDEQHISPELRAKYTNISLDKALRLEDLVNEFFDITRFSLTTLTLEPETVNLTRMLEQITYEFNPVLAEKGLTIKTHLAPDIHISCDPDKLERVFDNLLRNAVNYSYRDTSITLTMTQCQDCVVIQVANHGKTIPAEKLSRIFEQFFRLDSSRASSTGGAGLGLAIAKEIIELHNGTIQAQSNDESILFTVKLPFHTV